MAKKGLYDTSDLKFLGLNVGLAVVVAIVILVGLIMWLNGYTQHGKEVEVADVRGLQTEQAGPLLAEQGLQMVIIDSTYSDRVPFGTIVEQNPKPQSHAKNGRTVYVTINATGRRKVAVPDMQDMSYRQAETTLKGIGLYVDSVYEYQPSEFRDLVLDVKAGGVSVKPGTKLDVGTRVKLVVGQGRGTEQVEVPSVIGMTLSEARMTLLNQRLTVGAVNYDEPAEEGTPQYVYSQVPAAGTMLVEGETVAMRLSTDADKANSAHRTNDNEEDNWF